MLNEHRLEEEQLSPKDLGMVKYSDVGLSAFTAFALVILCWAFLWYKSYNPFEPSSYFNIIFHETANLNSNAGVFLKGVRVGVVDKIDIADGDDILVRIRVNAKKVKVPNNAHFQILTNGLVGARYVDIVLPPTEKRGAALANNAEVRGDDPVRLELAMNKVANAVEDLDFDGIKHQLSEDRKSLLVTSERVRVLADRAIPVLDNARPLTAELRGLTRELTKTTKSVNKIVNDPKFSGDLKESMRLARDTVDKLRSVTEKVQETLADTSLRTDVITALQQLNQSTGHIENALGNLGDLASDKDLRSDVKTILGKANESLDKVQNLVSDPGFGEDLRKTLSASRQTLEHVDLAAKQMNQILAKKRPLLHLIFGRPGKIDDAEKLSTKSAEEKSNSDKKSKSAAKGSYH